MTFSLMPGTSYSVNTMNGHILIIDTISIPPVLKDVLNEADFAVDIVPVIGDGMKLDRVRHYDAIVLLEQPGADCRSHCEVVRLATDAPLIVISPNAGTETCLEAIKAGADFFLRKPFGPLEFIARIKTLLNRAPSRTPVQRMAPAAVR